MTGAEPLLAPTSDDVAQLADVLVACVADGASVGWVAPPGPEAAAAWWGGFLSDGSTRTWVARDEAGRIVGTASLMLAAQENGRHRAEVVKVLVHPRARRRGLARTLLGAVEEGARTAGRSLLVLDTNEGSDAEHLYVRSGYRRVGAIPGFSVQTDGTLHATVVYYRRVGVGAGEVPPQGDHLHSES
ncbi:GNAT family N-acetyltransferase [Luteimicrobium xylanilyticum]|uniref:Phosphinothricin acetyltransferase n=1 Tax=Luteimicrobium xylanilyticum TaxID=1133546 RepID=A0A5P9Q6U6_9MICO|nr:GNAT family N-acetyltransferase [Luteimicrobium xylanilyticum]QFU96996.1 Phosphinothricin acetyltransferase [Luteimicrobium xylanilyticum]